jgi:hypothetical protein
MEKTQKTDWFRSRFIPIAVFLSLTIVPQICFADLQGSLDNIKFQLTHLILPTLSVIGMAIAAVSFFSGNPQAKTHMFYAVMGCCFGFGAEGIMSLIRSIVN